ncbi:MAG: methionine synthase [Xylanivirga thermophila]|jgi:hypothetical protein
MIKVHIDINEVLRYLGVGRNKADMKLKLYISECIKEILDIAYPMYVYKMFDLKFTDEYAWIKQTNTLLMGKDINRYLNGCFKCAVMGATLGISVDKRIRYYKSYDLTRSFVLDACATALIENVCDKVQEEIKLIAKEEYHLNIMPRYSPGYGDFPLDIQPDLLNILEANRIGLTVNDNLIMIPRKSVTAIIGLKDKGVSVNMGCESCLKRDSCNFRRE